MNQNTQLPVYVLPDRAKDALMGHFTRVILIYITYTMLGAGLSLAISNVLSPGSYPGLALYLVAGLAASLLTELLHLGYHSVFLAISSKAAYSTRNLFCGFRHNSNQILLLAALFTLIRTLTLLPSQLLPFLSSEDSWGPWGYDLLFWGTILLGNVLYAIFTIPFSLSYFLILDFPGMSAGQALGTSVRKMRGQTLRFLALILRFLPLQLLCVCSLFLGFLWLKPYWLMTKTCFYMEIMKAPKS